MSKEFVLAITEHRKFGAIFISYMITPAEGESFYSSIERANLINIKEASNYCDDIEKIQSYINEYDDNQIANFFTKKKEDAVHFIKNVGSDLVESRIRPFVERRLHKIANILEKKDIRLYFKDNKYTKIYAADRISMVGHKAVAVFNFNKTSEGLQYYLNIQNGNETVSLKNKKAMVLTQEPCTLFLNNKVYRFKYIDDKKLKPFFAKDYISIPRQTEKAYFQKFVYNTILNFKVKAKGFDIIEDNVSPKPVLCLQNDMAGNPALLLKFDYGSKVILPNSPEKIILRLNYEEDSVTFFKTKRDFSSENNVCSLLNDYGLTNNNQSYYNVETEQNDDAGRLYEIVNWINRYYNELKEAGFEFRQDFYDRKYHIDNLNLDVKVREENDWFDVRGIVILGKYKIPFIKLRKNILKGIREYELPDGSVVILPQEWFAKYKDLFAFADSDVDSLKLNRMHFLLVQGNLEGTDYKKYKKLDELFKDETGEECPVPDGVMAELRPYQKIGFNWMNKLRENNFGGCLADDMGLGKTLQTLTFLMEVSKEKIEVKKPAKQKGQQQLSLFETNVEVNTISPTNLIVMPASLVHNWYSEIKKFTPGLRTLCHTGNQRADNISSFSSYDIILTTYGVIRNDSDMLSKFMFHYLILDESQAIKNSDSKNYKSIMLLNARHRLALTGTPIENSLTDLWSQINFVNRGLLGNINYFKKEFVAPIEKFKSRNQSEKLQSLIHPFVLRRTKDQVAKDLPPKTEQFRLCEMDEEQRKIYEEEKSAVRNNILESMENNGAGKSSILMLESLMKLRQLANHPKLVNFDADSGKFGEVTRMLHNVLAEKHKVLIFSSFVRHLDIYKDYLEENDIKYSILTGQTRDRKGVIDDFQNNDDNRVFLISLKAGGVGLNLTAADYVFLLDPWWNPASENQAVNRAHRIGQSRNVFVYRFISKGSIEEKIIQLQERKSNLADQFVNSNNPFKSMTKEDIGELFE